ncbi:MAG: carbamate kinase [Nitriliruptorales bacterium]|nr:carbamate kinase [Nitriliruptorales bacterium]
MEPQQRKRIVVALGGNAIAPAGQPDTPEVEISNVRRTMAPLAELVDRGFEVVITHGNGPQVGAVLRKNELARHELPPIPLDWCVAETQATIGFLVANALGWELERRGVGRPVVPVVSRVRVSRDDSAFARPSKPIGGYLQDPDEIRRRQQDGEVFVHHGERGWRRVVPSPEPLESLDRRAAELLLEDGAVVVANGGGGIPVTIGEDGRFEGVEAVVDKDLSAALLAAEVGADRLVILTDVRGVALDHGDETERWLEEVGVEDLRRYSGEGQFGTGSMAPKVEAACRFLEQGGELAVIGSLDDALDVTFGRAGTRVHS